MRNYFNRVTIVTVLSVSGTCSLVLYSLYRYFQQQDPRTQPDHDTNPGSGDLLVGPETDSGPLIPHITKYGKPSILQEIKKPGYYILYNTLTKTPLYVVEKLTKEGLSNGGGVEREGMNFHPELDLNSTVRVRPKNTDYTGSGFDRGHMAAAGNHVVNEDAMSETFTLGNAVPQFPACNRGNWKTLENHVRVVAKQADTNVVYVYSGPLFVPQTPQDSPDAYVIYKVIGDSYIAVPTHFFKVLVVECGRKVAVDCFIAENAPDTATKSTEEMRVSLAEVETWSGISFDKLRKYT